jgi:hypothetical protein
MLKYYKKSAIFLSYRNPKYKGLRYGNKQSFFNATHGAFEIGGKIFKLFSTALVLITANTAFVGIHVNGI